MAFWPTAGGAQRRLENTPIPDPNGGGYEVFLATRSFPGVVERIDPKKNYAVTQELDIRALFAKAWGVDELSGPCLSAYNRFTPATDPATGEPIHLIGVWVEHPQRAESPHNGSCYMVRRRDATYTWGSIYDPVHPLPDGKGLHGTRTIEVSPFPEDQSKVFYFGGHDCAGRPSHNTAWIYKGPSS